MTSMTLISLTSGGYDHYPAAVNVFRGTVQNGKQVLKFRVRKASRLAAVTSAMPAVQVATECAFPEQTVHGVGQHFSPECGPVDLKCNAFWKRYMAVHNFRISGSYKHGRTNSKLKCKTLKDKDKLFFHLIGTFQNRF